MFPAYAVAGTSDGGGNAPVVSPGMMCALSECQPAGVEPAPMSPSVEHALLASDEDEPPHPAAAAAASPPRNDASRDEYYVDRKLDRGYIPVTTLYYPGRPNYTSRSVRAALGSPRRRPRSRPPTRYYSHTHAHTGASDEHEAELRARAYRSALRDDPHNQLLWLQYIDFQEWCGSEARALEAARSAQAQCPASPALRQRLLLAMRLALTPDQHAEQLRDMLAQEKDPSQRLELWQRLMTSLCGTARGDAALLCAGAALGDVGSLPQALPQVVHVYGSYLRSAGQWEQVVQLVELLLAMNLPPAPAPAHFPPPPDAARCADAERQLAEYEHKVTGSGLPLGTVWSRVERARREVHWAPCTDDAQAQLDPQRAPRPADLAPLLVPARSPLLLLALLDILEVPCLPCAGYVQEALGAGAADVRASWGAGGGAVLPALLRAARRLPRVARPAPAAARSLLTLTPLRAYSAARTDTTGFGEWVSGLWEAALEWSAGSVREALLCWRLRVLHAHALLHEPGSAEARRVEANARALVKRHAGQSTLPYVLLARLRRSAPCALRALRAALRQSHPHAPLHHARVVGELSGDYNVGLWAICAGVLRRAELLERAAEAPASPPPSALVHEAFDLCSARCAEIEARLCGAGGEGSGGAGGGEDAEGAEGSMLCGEGEWAAARVALAPPDLPPRLLAALLHDQVAGVAGGGVGWRYSRWREQAACALVQSAQRHHRAVQTARALLPLFSHNGYIAMMSASGPVWARSGSAEAGAARGVGPHGELAALAGALPALLGAAAAGWAPPAAGAAVRAVRGALRGRGAGAAGAGTLRALLLEMEARARGPHHATRALYQALDAAPHAQWTYIVGAAHCPQEAAALPDLLLERQLRLHALPDELRLA